MLSKRDRLIELLSQYFNIGDSYAYNLTRVKSAFGAGTMSMDDFEEFDDDTIDELADHLLASGVIVPPVVSGQTVYLIVDKEVCEVTVRMVEGVILDCAGKERYVFYQCWTNSEGYKEYFNLNHFGKTIFLTREEAEQTLERRRKEDSE